jgi:hypothetical protein
VKFHGHNRYDVVNKLKPYIANNRVEKHGKGKDPSNILNVTNYLMLTNHEDAIPIEEGDRRYFVLFSPFRLLADLDVLLQADYFISVAEHFEEVFSSVRENPAQLALWLSETEFPAEWDANMSAPMTEEKTAMVAASRSDLEAAMDDIFDDLRSGHPVLGVTPDLLSMSHLRRALHTYNIPLDLPDRMLAKALRQAGFGPAPGSEKGKALKVSWQNDRLRIWTRGGVAVSNDYVKACMDKTVSDDFE